MEGGFSKALLLRRADGQEYLAKLPCPNAGPSHLTTASEVAVLQLGMSCWFSGAAPSAHVISSPVPDNGTSPTGFGLEL